MSEERLFVIMEVEKFGDLQRGVLLRPVGCKRVNIEGNEFLEALELDASRIIKGSRLRYGIAELDELYFSPNLGGWAMPKYISNEARLILSPEPEEEDTWLLG